MRLFIAIPIAPSAREAIATAVATLRHERPPVVEGDAFKWVRAENWHVTLKFLGEVPGEGVDAISRAVDSIASQSRPFTLHPSALALHPSAGRVRLIVAQLAGDVDACRGLAGQIEAALVPLGVLPERRGFWPHVTIARARVPERIDARQRTRWSNATSRRALDPRPIDVDTIELIKSQLLPTGPAYTRLASFPLGRRDSSAPFGA